MGAGVPTPGVAPAYGSFAARLRAMTIDAVVSLAGVAVILLLAMALHGVPGSGRVAVVVLALFLVCYEPVLVWRRGGTVGHRRANLVVVHDATGGPPGLPRALARFVLKNVLGLPSFVAMASTRRHQAIHDRLTGTTVRIRDLSLAAEWEVRWERPAGGAVAMPSRARRLAVTLAYVIAAFLVVNLVSALAVSDECLLADRCSQGERVGTAVLGIVLLTAVAGAGIAGWQGKLWGCRARAATARVDEGVRA